MKYQNQVLPFKFKITEAYSKKLSDKDLVIEIFQKIFFDVLFPTATTIE